MDSIGICGVKTTKTLNGITAESYLLNFLQNFICYMHTMDMNIWLTTHIYTRWSLKFLLKIKWFHIICGSLFFVLLLWLIIVAFTGEKMVDALPCNHSLEAKYQRAANVRTIYIHRCNAGNNTVLRRERNKITQHQSHRSTMATKKTAKTGIYYTYIESLLLNKIYMQNIQAKR